MDVGEHATLTEVIEDGATTVTVAEPDSVESCVDVAVIVAVPGPLGVNMPPLLTVPITVGPMDHETEVLKLPVP